MVNGRWITDPDFGLEPPRRVDDLPAADVWHPRRMTNTGDGARRYGGWTACGACALVIFGMSVVTCAEPRRSPDGDPRPSPTPRAASAAARAAASAADSAATSAQVRPASTAPLPTVTPGKISCDEAQCDLEREVCCISRNAAGSSKGRCLPKAPAGAPSPCCNPKITHHCGEDALERSCDEAGDCETGQRCCDEAGSEFGLYTQRCGKAGECAKETCLAGSTCPNGRRCAADEGRPTGACPLQVKPPRCGSATCLEGEACCFDVNTNKSRCASACTSAKESTFRCTSPADCAPYDCNTQSGSVPPFVYICGGGGFVNGVLCEKLSDCPVHLSALGSQPGAPKRKSCSPITGLPEVKQCVYDDK